MVIAGRSYFDQTNKLSGIIGSTWSSALISTKKEEEDDELQSSPALPSHSLTWLFTSINLHNILMPTLQSQAKMFRHIIDVWVD